MKNKEPLILAVVVFFTLVTYYLVEPFAHNVLHKHVESENFEYKDLPALTKKGNAANGKAIAVDGYACISCHSIEVAGMTTGMSAKDSAGAYGVNPPDLSNAGVIYNEKFLVDLIKNPAHALKLEHIYGENKKAYPMSSFFGAGGDLEQEVADIVAYLQSIAVKQEDLTPAMAYENACGRCHEVHYENWTHIGTKPSFKHKKDELAFEIETLEYKDSLVAYLGKLPPDLSMYIRSRGEHYITNFMEDPQAYFKGTSMPRVGVTKESAEKVIEYLQDSGDTKRHERESIAKNVMIYIIIFAIFALLWKKEVWKDLH